jgi:hypothetical protein
MYQSTHPYTFLYVHMYQYNYVYIYINLYKGMVPRVVKHGGMVSLSYPWYVTSAVKSHLGLLNVLEANGVSTDSTYNSETDGGKSLIIFCTQAFLQACIYLWRM